MTGWLLDTNVLSELRRPRPDRKVLAFIAAQPIERLYVSAVTFAEIRFGIERLEDSAHRQRLLLSADRLQSETFFNRILPFDTAAALVYGRITAQRQARGRPIGIIDCMIASIAIAHGAAVASRDSYGFADLGLTIINPFNPEP